ncbi:hypothetical protein PMAYCL1PPCAC_26391, partial [Pristionchus mayeri]
MSVIMLIDGDFELVDRSSLKKGSVEGLGEKCFFEYHGVRKEGIFCQGGFHKAMEKEIGNWRDGTKTIDNQRKKKDLVSQLQSEIEMNGSQKRTVIVRGKSVEVAVREKREKRKKESGRSFLPSQIAREISDDGLAAVEKKAKVVKENIESSKSRKLGRSVERESNRNPTPVLEDDSEEEEEGAAPDLSGLSGVLAAVQAMGSTLGKHMKALEKKFDDGMRKVNARIDRLEDQADEIADAVEGQRAMVRQVASATPSIVANAQKAAQGTDSIKDMMPAPPKGF